MNSSPLRLDKEINIGATVTENNQNLVEYLNESFILL